MGSTEKTKAHGDRQAALADEKARQKNESIVEQIKEITRRTHEGLITWTRRAQMIATLTNTEPEGWMPVAGGGHTDEPGIREVDDSKVYRRIR